MKRITGTVLAAMAVSGTLALAPGLTSGEEGGNLGKGARGKWRGEFRQECRAHFEQQREENQDFRKTIKDMEPSQAVAAMKTQRDKQYAENKTFIDAEYNKLVEAIKAKLADKEGKEAGLAEVLKKLEEHHTARLQKMETRHTELDQMLDQLSQKQGLTWEDIKTAIKEFRAKYQGDRKGDRKPHGGATPTTRV